MDYITHESIIPSEKTLSDYLSHSRDCERVRSHPLFGHIQSDGMQWIQSDDFVKTVLEPPNVFPHDADVMVTWDTEYVSLDEVGEPVGDRDVQALTNRVLSYQFCALYRDQETTERRIATFIWWPTPDKPRLTLAECVSLVMHQLGISNKRGEGMKTVFYSHYGVAEWSCLADRERWCQSPKDGGFDAVRKVFYSMDAVDIVPVTWNRHRYGMKLYWKDTTLIAPAGYGSLDKLLSFVSVGKLKLADAQKSRMDLLLENDPELFIQYAIRDVVGLMEYVCHINEIAQNTFKLPWMPATLGSMSVSFFEQFLTGKGKSIDDMRGYEQAEIVNSKGRIVKCSVKSHIRQSNDSIAAASYYGGLNVAYRIGDCWSSDRVIIDMDFSGAYPAAMSTLPDIDWKSRTSILVDFDKAVEASKVEFFGDNSGHQPIVLAECDFEFPATEYNPCCPVPSKNGLIFPLKGRTYVTAPELVLMKEKGCKVTNLQAYVYPMKFNSENETDLAFADCLAVLQNERAKFKKGTLHNALYKEASNSLYGKTAQGIRDRIIRNHMGTDGKQLDPSKVTCPAYAAMTTAIVRVALLDMVDASRHIGCTVLSATTDGAMVSVPIEYITDMEQFKANNPDLRSYCPKLYEAISNTYGCKLLNLGKRNMGFPEDSWLEVKHRGDRARTAKTRMYFLEYKGEAQHVARGGHQTPDRSMSTGMCLIERLMNDDGIEEIEGKTLAKVRDIVNPDVPYSDLVAVKLKRRANADYDQKRCPTNETVGEGMDTKPWPTINDAKKNRKAHDIIRKQGRRAGLTEVRLAANDVQLRGGSHETIQRYIRRLIVGRKGGWGAFMWKGKGKNEKRTYATMAHLAQCLDVSVDTLYQDRNRQSATTLPECREVETIMADMAMAVGLQLTDTMRSCVYGKIIETDDEIAA